MATSNEEITGLEANITQLLGHLSSHFDYSGCIDHLDPATVQEYNKYMDIAHGVFDKDGQIAFSKLPPELLVEILWYATAPELKIYIIDRVLELTLVCTKWSHLIMTTPKLWTYVELAKDIEDAEAKLSLALHLSHQLPLTVFYDYNWQLFAPFLYPHVHRVRAAIWAARFSNQVLDKQNSIHTYFSPSSLQVIDLQERGWPSEHSVYDTEYRALISWVYTNYRCIVDAQTFGNNIRVLDAGISTVEELIAIMELKAIGRVTIHIPSSKFLDLDPEVEDPHSNAGKLIARIRATQTLAWTHFSYMSMSWLIASHLLNCISDTVVHLCISLADTDLVELRRLVNEMRLLDVLDLTISSSSQSLSSFSAPARNKLPITSLTLRIYTNALDVTDVIILFCQSAPNLRNLGINSPRGIIVMKEIHFESIPNLYTFTAHCAAHHNGVFHNVGHLKVMGSLADFAAMPGSTARYLRCYLVFQSALSSFILTSDSWPCLEILSLKTSHSRMHRGTLFPCRLELHRLERLELGCASAASITHMVASNPTELPSLGEIQFECPPEWDILFILLERRLFLALEGVTPISVLVLGCRPLDEICIPLVKLLRGHVVRRMSNYQLSIQTNLDRVLDSVHDCCFHYSNKRRQLPETLQLPTYPSAAQDILDTWFERTYIIEDMIDPAKLVWQSCGKGACTLTKYTDIVADEIYIV